MWRIAPRVQAHIAKQSNFNINAAAAALSYIRTPFGKPFPKIATECGAGMYQSRPTSDGSRHLLTYCLASLPLLQTSNYTSRNPRKNPGEYRKETIYT